MKNCVFCQIVEGKIPCHKIYEDKNFLAFLDIAPFCEGHTLVIPKKHYRWVWDVPNIGYYFFVVKKIVKHYREVFGDEFIASIIWGMLVEHAHVQILPNPRNLSLIWSRGKLTTPIAQKLLKKLKLK
jgi:histidine triad (HIT) family protein